LIQQLAIHHYQLQNASNTFRLHAETVQQKATGEQFWFYITFAGQTFMQFEVNMCQCFRVLINKMLIRSAKTHRIVHQK